MLLVGTTQMLPDEPGAVVLPGNRKVSQLNLISEANRPYHHDPETSIGTLPAMNAVPMSSALRLADCEETYPFFTHCAKVSTPYLIGSAPKSTGFL